MELDLTSYARRGPTHRDRFSPDEIAFIARTARRAPEVMVKVTRGATNSRGVMAHLAYISRKGELEIEIDEGEHLAGRGMGQQLIEDWDLDMEEHRKGSNLLAFDRRTDPKLIHQVIFSMPAEALIAAIHIDWGEAQGNYDEFRFFTGLRPSEQAALLVDDCDLRRQAQGQ
jgi:hypothetical protein